MSPHMNGNGVSNWEHPIVDLGVIPEDAIAIIGMARRFPQDAENPEKLWKMLLEGRSASSEFPKDRVNLDAHYHPNPTHGGTVSSSF
jgi:acyl transferase domain-containing protein